MHRAMILELTCARCLAVGLTPHFLHIDVFDTVAMLQNLGHDDGPRLLLLSNTFTLPVPRNELQQATRRVSHVYNPVLSVLITTCPTIAIHFYFALHSPPYPYCEEYDFYRALNFQQLEDPM